MPETTPKENRETWQDWMPADLPAPTRLLTRNELIDQLQAAGVAVSASDLRYWEYEGVLPRAVRQWRDGANWVVYPRWIASTIALLRALQRASSLSLQEIAPILEQESGRLARQSAGLEQIENDRPGSDIPISMFLWLGLDRFTQVSLGPSLNEHARVVSELFGKSVGSIRLEVLDREGESIAGGSYVHVPTK